jgi:AraC-like DNA-binding protein
MCLTAYEESMLQALYDYSRIPAWIYNENRQLQSGFFSETQPRLKQILSEHIDKILSEITRTDFDILCYENEAYFIFSFTRNGHTYYCLGGPMLLSGFYPSIAKRYLSFTHKMDSNELESLIVMLPVISMTPFSSFLRMIMLLLKREPLSTEEISSYHFTSLQDSLRSTFVHELFDNREDFMIHTPYSHEIAVLNCIKEGNVTKLESTYKALPEIKYGHMSKDPLRQFFYGCIANTTLVTRYAIEGGLDEETAFTLSDVYIKQMENCRTLYELNILNEKMAIDFTQQVAIAKSSKQRIYAEPIAKCIDYIFMNIHEKMTLETLAKQVNLTQKYLSCLFHKETGQTLSAFIEDCRINEAKNLLVYSQYSYSQISSYLSFNSHSYFISVFKKRVGMTPKEYRTRYSQMGWKISRLHSEQ